MERQLKLFMESERESKLDIVVTRLANDVGYAPEVFNQVKELVCSIDDLYPGIEGWYDKKVIPGVKSGERDVYAVLAGGVVVADAVVKHGERTKICNMRIIESFQEQALGMVVFHSIARELTPFAKDVYFTAPESLANAKQTMFESLGFSPRGRSPKEYRPGEDEIAFSSSALSFRAASEQWWQENCVRFRGRAESAVISIKPEFARKVVSGNKTVEVRRQASRNLEGVRVYIYSTHPDQAVVGEATVTSVVADAPENIWALYAGEIGCSNIEYDHYVEDRRNVFALLIGDVVPYETPIPWNTFSSVFRAKVPPPQNYMFMSRA